MNRLVVLILLCVSTTLAEPTVPKEAGLIAHEWGTFTTVSGGSGTALDWRPLSGPSDLPQFVHSNRQKLNWRGPVRMETPVIYFYTDRERTVGAKVAFTEGQVTEWYPWGRPFQADAGSRGIDWGQFRLLPPNSPAAKDLKLKRTETPSHYYPARNVDAAYVRSCAEQFKAGVAEYERFLFYRGVGNASMPLEVSVLGDSELHLRNTSSDAIPAAFVFERSGDAVRWAVLGELPDGHEFHFRPARLAPSTLNGVEAQLHAALVATGLYSKEAKAMVATWRDHWFEDGLRVFYVIPRSVTDRLLPLTLTPQPAELVRTIVGRVEALTPAYSERLLKLVKRYEAGDTSAIKDAFRHGRFAEPALEQLVRAGAISHETFTKLTR